MDHEGIRRWVGKAASAFALLALLCGCASRGAPQAEEPIAWVQWDRDGQAQVRIATGMGPCPAVQADGHALPVRTRAQGGTAPDASAPATRRLDWSLQVCEADVPRGTGELRVGTQRLPVPVPQPRRIVVLGDSGCRLAHGTLQDCGNPDAWPFARIAAAAAARKPDLVIHVGDYHYREQPCPAGASGCAGSPWGYGWDPWRADFFAPAAPLLAAAPWVFVRGNHEECARAGQGWFRLLAPGPFEPRRSCDDPRDDPLADYDAPYAVPLGDGLQLLVVDSAVAGNAPLDPRRPRDALTRDRYAQDMREVARLADRPGVRSWFVSHHPVLGFAPSGAKPTLYPGNPALQEALRAANGPALFPPGVQLALHGHVHLFEALAFDSGEPPAIVAGTGGDWLDEDLGEAALARSSPAPGVRIREALHASRFGYLLFERADPVGNEWAVTAFGTDGSVFARCHLGPGRAFRCEPKPPAQP